MPRLGPESSDSLFHVKQDDFFAAPSTDRPVRREPRSERGGTRLFHVKQRRLLAIVLGLVALIGTGCAAIQNPEGWAAPVEIDGQILVQSNKGQVSLVNPENGQVAWTYPDEDSQDRALYATPLVEGSSVFLADYSGRLTRLDIGGGSPEEAWSTSVNAQVVATPALEDGTLYVATDEGRIVLLEVAEGSIIDTIDTSDRRIWGAPALRGDTIYVGDLDNGVTVALDVTSGERIWEQEISGPTAADLTLDGDLLFAPAFDQHVHALEVANEGAERWAFEGDGWFLGRPVVRNDAIFVASMNGFVYAIDRVTGAELWSFEAPDGQFRGSPVTVGGHLVAAARDGRVFALDMETGAVAWEQDATNEGNVNADPLVIGNNIYLVTSRHELVRVDASNGASQDVPLAANR